MNRVTACCDVNTLLPMRTCGIETKSSVNRSSLLVLFDGDMRASDLVTTDGPSGVVVAGSFDRGRGEWEMEEMSIILKAERNNIPIGDLQSSWTPRVLPANKLTRKSVLSPNIIF